MYQKGTIEQTTAESEGSVTRAPRTTLRTNRNR